MMFCFGQNRRKEGFKKEKTRIGRKEEKCGWFGFFNSYCKVRIWLKIRNSSNSFLTMLIFFVQLYKLQNMEEPFPSGQRWILVNPFALHSS